ncbi:hypothetical protein ES703_56158 [subsurface metagenome]
MPQAKKEPKAVPNLFRDISGNNTTTLSIYIVQGISQPEVVNDILGDRLPYLV